MGTDAFASQNGIGANGSSHGNESTPLFFAIEKQNELKTARDEINRLANMLGDAESAKQEAFDAMKDGGELLTWHSPRHNAIGCNCISCKVDVVRVHVNRGAP